MREYAITFGVQYGLYPKDPHPAFPDHDVSSGWLTIVAPDEDFATKVATLICGESSRGIGRWAFSYELDELLRKEREQQYFPLGEFARVVVDIKVDDSLAGKSGRTTHHPKENA